MARFVLQPCHFRETQFAPLKGTEPVVFDWAGLVEALAPSRDRAAQMTLRQLQPGAYVGIVRDRTDASVLRNFVVINPDRSAKLEWVLKKDPTFETRLVSVYRVDSVKWESVVTEFDTPGIPTWTK